jgi:hypothetical protein
MPLDGPPSVVPTKPYLWPPNSWPFRVNAFLYWQRCSFIGSRHHYSMFGTWDLHPNNKDAPEFRPPLMQTMRN